MTIATEKKKRASDRFLLVRFEPARYIEPTSIGGGVYQITFDYPVSRVQRNGTDLTSVTSFSGNDQYIFTESTNTLQVKLASAPSETSNVICAFYYLFYTSSIYRRHPQTPTDSTSTLRNWKARLKGNPSFFQSYNNIQNGILTIADSSINLINPFREFQQYLTDDDSFHNKKIDIWMCINSIENIQKVYTGTTKDVKIAGDEVRINIVDSLSKLKNTAYMGDSEGECIFSRESGSFSSLHPASSGAVCPFIVSDLSRYTSLIFDFDDGEIEKITEGTKGYCTNYDTAKSGTTNREWGACRSYGNITTQVDVTGRITTVTQLDTVVPFSPIYYRFTCSGSDLSNIYVGDTFRFTQSAHVYYMIITKVNGSASFEARFHGWQASVDRVTPLTSLTHNPCPAMNVMLRGLTIDADKGAPGDMAYCLYGRDYTVSTTTTNGGNKFHTIIFEDNFETNFSTYGNPDGPDSFSLDPDLVQMEYRVSVEANDPIGLALGRILVKAGMLTSGQLSTFADGIDNYISATPCFHIPNIDETSYDSYLKYVQDILSATLCYLKVNDSGYARAAPLSAPTSTDKRNGMLMLEGSINVDIEYQDIITTFIPYNPHMPRSASTLESSVTSNKSKYLHEVVNLDRFKHPLYSISDRIQDHINLKSNRKAIYRYEVATEDVDSELGDDILISNRITLGESEEKSVKLVSIDKSTDRIGLEASDLLGISDVIS